MTDLIEIQLITSSIIIAIFALILRFKLLRKAFHSLELEDEHFAIIHGTLVVVIIYLAFLIVRDLLKVLL